MKHSENLSVMDGHATVKTLEAELKLLRWHKLANESALKAAILKDKQMKRRDKSVSRILNDSKIRLAAVIEDERSKDLLVREMLKQYMNNNILQLVWLAVSLLILII